MPKNPANNDQTDSRSAWWKSELARAFAKSIFFTFLFLLLFFGLTFLGIGFFVYQKAQEFSKASETPLPELIELAQRGWKTSPKQTNGKTNFLILGTDAVANRGNSTVLTDTMLIASLNLQTGQVSMLSFPRDLWHVEYQTRINALYTYGKERFPEEPARFPRETLEEMLGINIHYTIVLDLETVAKFVDTLGGIEIHVEQGFIDTEFPRNDVDISTETDPKKLYQTVEFQSGTEKMSGERVLQYIRSRHAEGDQGTDIAREKRQQQVISTLLQTLSKQSFYTDMQKVGQIFSFYREHFHSSFPMEEAIGTLRQLYPVLRYGKIQFTSNGLSIFPDDPNGVLIHPPVQKYKNQWVYEIRNVDLFKKETHQKLGL